MQHAPDWYNVAFKIFLKNDKGEILILKNSPPRDAANTLEGPVKQWHDLPGGRINDNEFQTPYETIIDREIREELGKDLQYQLDLMPVSFGRHNYYSDRQGKEVRIMFICFEAYYLGGKVEISDEHAGFAWLDPHQINLEDYFTKGALEAATRYKNTH